MKILLCTLLTMCAVHSSGAADTENYLCIGRFPVSKSNIALHKVNIVSDQFSLSFIHSVSKTPVFDDYIINSGQIIQIQERFLNHGAGLPSGTDDGNETSWQIKDGVFHLKMNRLIKRLVVRVNPEYKNTLLVGENKFDLTRWGRRAIEIKFCKQILENLD